MTILPEPLPEMSSLSAKWILGILTHSVRTMFVLLWLSDIWLLSVKSLLLCNRISLVCQHKWHYYEDWNTNGRHETLIVRQLRTTNNFHFETVQFTGTKGAGPTLPPHEPTLSEHFPPKLSSDTGCGSSLQLQILVHCHWVWQSSPCDYFEPNRISRTHFT